MVSRLKACNRGDARRLLSAAVQGCVSGSRRHWAAQPLRRPTRERCTLLRRALAGPEGACATSSAAARPRRRPLLARRGGGETHLAQPSSCLRPPCRDSFGFTSRILFFTGDRREPPPRETERRASRGRSLLPARRRPLLRLQGRPALGGCRPPSRGNAPPLLSKLLSLCPAAD